MSINPEIKAAVDRRLDAGLPNIPSGHDGKCVVHLLRYIECYFRFVIPHEVAKRGVSSEQVLKSRALNAAGLCVALCCKDQVSNFEHGWCDGVTTDVDIAAWKAVFDDALLYSDMCDWMFVLWNESFNIEQISDVEFVFSYSSKHRKGFEVADWLLKRLEIPQLQAAGVDVSFLANEIRSHRLDESLAFALPISILRRVQEWVAFQQGTLWKLGLQIPLDGFDLTEFRKFWTALSTMAAVHKFAWNNIDRNGLMAVSIAVIERVALTERLSQLSGLASDRVSLLLRYIACDAKRWKSGKSQDSILQPIFELGDRVALSSSLILETNVERNILDLVNRTNPQVYDRVKDLKEADWSGEIEQILSSYGLIAKPQIKYEDTAMDVIIVDPTYEFAVTCELKWLLTPDRFKGSQVDYVSKGFDQALRACEWATNNRDAVTEKLTLPRGALHRCEFRPLLLCKDTLLSGLATHSDIPIASGALFDWLVKKKKGNIREIWTILNEKTFLPIEGRHFQERKSKLKFNGITFHVVGLDDASEASNWNPVCNLELELREW